TWLVVSPSAASSTTRARTASCCPVVCARTSRSSAARSSPLSTISGGFGPGMARATFSTKMAHPTRPPPHLWALLCLTVLAACRPVARPAALLLRQRPHLLLERRQRPADVAKVRVGLGLLSQPFPLVRHVPAQHGARRQRLYLRQPNGHAL